ncbi:bifunctional 2-polyprenyl-6-hydroxyphenol methylase/3-demethylubiquinol 3-O-methyltransferase UbiG [Magnetospirillum sp. UT-4]|uniref:class I SAM-dependent methyltransferase n=1 Tax=Magnetospirillum sp. UT-4 TaxID=2681467 RepID=UPI001381EEF1|nr:class I SAM-dependent methyltransferase [Magnetospirillum sp. UT-4]CAA7612129.1 hypothetical protein MTBUT4_110058 [Magnetospirillum sp. UT-4]
MSADHAKRLSDAKYSAGTEIERTSKVFTRNRVPDGPPALHILDVGCGTGVNAQALAAKGHRLFGIDVSPVAVERYVAAGFEATVADITAGFGVPEGQFDLVFASEVIEHVADTEAFLAECLRALKPGGRLVLSTPNSAFWPMRLLGLAGRTATEIQHPGHLRFFSRRGLESAVAAAGFAEVAVAARHMYVVLSESWLGPLRPLMKALGFTRELRFRTGTYVWHLSRFAPFASSWWSDTLIVTARRP